MTFGTEALCSLSTIIDMCDLRSDALRAQGFLEENDISDVVFDYNNS